MESRERLVAANWKMNGTRESAGALLAAVKNGLDSTSRTRVAVCPPFVYLAEVAELLAGTGISLGAQDVSHRGVGAFTGEIAAPMLKDLGCEYVIVGHSERRALYAEDDSLVAEKFRCARAQGLRPILCVGETLQEREAGQTEQVVCRQLDAVLVLEGVEALSQAVIAYEPVWAIGTGRTATPEQANTVHAAIRERVANGSGEVAKQLRILYGGSVKGANAASLFAQADIDGGLIGGASLEADEFLAICHAAPSPQPSP